MKKIREFEQDSLLTTLESARIVGAEPSSLKQSRHTGVLFGKAAPVFLKMGRSTRYQLSTLLEFRQQFPQYQNTSEFSGEEAS